jgi:tetratricopeptide (TPR) repeat protein
MRTAKRLHLSKRIPAGILLLLLLAGMIPVRPLSAAQAGDSDLEKTKSMAEMQHEIVLLLIKKKEYDKALAEANKIFEMKWPESQEPLLLKSLLYLSNQFLQQNQASIGLQLIDRNSRLFRKNESQVAVLKEKGYLYKSLGQDDKAIECFRQAQALENKK